jgi:hypothetical protein
MRIALAAVVACLAGCPLTSTSTSNGDCKTDNQCGGDVCARSGECLPRTEVRSVTVKWTVKGERASSVTCTHPDLYVQFDGNDYGDTLGFAPVPCREGTFTVDKLPKRFLQVELGIEGGATDISSIDAASGAAQFDIFQ